MDGWLAQVKQRYKAGDGAGFAALVDPDPTSTAFAALQHSLRSAPGLRATTYSSWTRSALTDNRTVADFLAVFLLYVRDADLPSQDAAALARAFSLLEDCFKSADRCFSTSEGGWFVPTLRKLSRTLVSLGLAVGRAQGDPRLTRAGEAARMLSRPIAIAANDRTSESPCKRDALFFLANATFRVYFALSNLRLCDTVLNNVQNANAPMDEFTMADRCTFLYYRGRIALYQRRLPQARNDLRRAFALCRADSWRNGRLILTYLVAASLPLGFFPTLPLLQHFNLFEPYATLIPSLKRGNFRGVLSELNRWQAWHLKCGNYLLLREKLETICWRNLARTTLFVLTNGSPLPPTGPPTLSLHALLAASRLSFQDPSLDVDDVESMCVSLMDQGYIKAYILHSKRILVLQKGPRAGFPPVATVNAVGG
ncbi:COP9 signalosome complex subunit 12 [Rhodotorula sp. JG-1b]|nr:COP9 signalosome complex subunit 12 [Rhodotorula sp. JG-1b]